MKRSIASALILLLLSTASFAQTEPWIADIGARYWMAQDVVYTTANNTQLKLDIWYDHNDTTPKPTLVYIHGGGWVFGSKEGAFTQFLPYLQKGWRVVNVEYRMYFSSLAPAAVEDTRCALRWVFNNAEQWKFDTKKIVLTGHSAGGHLSLITGMLPKGTPLDNHCYDEKEIKVAAIINWYGISDVNDLLSGPNLKNYAVMWMGSQPNAKEIAQSVSPINYVRSDLPPILSVHGDKDDVVPYAHSRDLHKKLTEVGVKNQLVTVPGGGHGGFASGEYVRAFNEIWKFLKANNITE